MKLRHIICFAVLIAALLVMQASGGELLQVANSKTSISATAADTNAHQLTTNTSLVGCKRVKLLAPQSFTSGSVNASPVSISFDGGTTFFDWIDTDGSRDHYENIDDPTKIWYRLGTANDHLLALVEK